MNIKTLLVVLVATVISACATWTPEHQAKFEKEQGKQTCPAFHDCYDLRRVEPGHEWPVLEKE